MFTRVQTIKLGDHHGEINVSESLGGDGVTVRYHITGPRIDGPVLISPNRYDDKVIPATLSVQLGQMRSFNNSDPLRVDDVPVLDVLTVDPRNTRDIRTVRQQERTAGSLLVHPVADSVQDHVALVVACLVDRWARRDDAPALRLAVACQTLAVRHQQEHDFYTNAVTQLVALCADVQSRVERIEMLETLARQQATPKH